MLICVRWEKSMCLAAKGRLQGWAAKLLLLCGGVFVFCLFNHAVDYHRRTVFLRLCLTIVYTPYGGYFGITFYSSNF